MLQKWMFWMFVIVCINSGLIVAACQEHIYAPASQIIILYILIYDKAGLSFYLAACM